MSVSRRALLTFAFVSEALKSHRDIIVGLAPLFNPIATDHSGEIFSPERLQTELAERYGLSITNDVAEFVSYSLHRAGLLKRREIGSDDLTFFWVAPPHPIANAPSHFEQKIEELGKCATAFAQAHPSLLNWNIDEESALNLLFDWIIDTDKQLSEAELIHNLTSEGTATPARKLLRSEEQYFCSRFTEWLKKQNRDLYNVLSEVGSAVMVSEVIMELREPTFSPDKRGSLYIYLDAPLCMEILGCSGKARKDDSAYLISGLKQFGAQVLIFSHSVDELKENINAVLKKRPGERRGPTATALLKGEVSEDHLLGVLRNADQYLTDAGIEIYDVRRTPLAISYTQSFPDSYQEGLLSKIQQNYKRLEAAERDALSAAIVMRRRNRHRSNDLFRTKHIMITRNPMVATISKRYCEEVGALDKNQFGPIIQARQAAALIWFAIGPDQKQELSRRQLVLNCSKAIESTPRVIEQLRRKLSEMRPDNLDTFDALIREPRNLQVAMDFAQGSESRAIESDPDALLTKLTETLTHEERLKHNAEVAKIKAQHRSEIGAKSDAEEKLQNELADLRTEVARQIEKQLSSIEASFEEFCQQCGRAILSVRIAFAVFVFLLAFLTSSVLLDKVDKAWIEGWTLVLSFAAATLVAIPIFADPIRIIESAVRKIFERRFAATVKKTALRTRLIEFPLIGHHIN